MNCERAMRFVMEADTDRRIPFAARVHLLFCADCRAEARRLNAALDFMGAECLPACPDFAARILGSIGTESETAAAPISFRNWIAVGITIIAAMILSPLSRDFGWVESTFGSNFLIPLNIVLGLVLALYCALFIGSHLAEICEKLGLPRAEKRV